MNYNATNDIAKLKANIQSAVAKEVEAFRAATGLAPSAISMRFEEVQQIGALRQHELVNVEVKFEY